MPTALNTDPTTSGTFEPKRVENAPVRMPETSIAAESGRIASPDCVIDAPKP